MSDANDDVQNYALAVLAGVVALVVAGVIALAVSTSLGTAPAKPAAPPAEPLAVCGQALMPFGFVSGIANGIPVKPDLFRQQRGRAFEALA